MHVVLFWAPVVYNDFVCFFGFMILSWGLNEKNHTGFCYFMPPSSPVLLRHFLLFEPLPVSSRCHFAFHPPHPLVRISAALLWASAGEYGSLWVFFFFFCKMSFVPAVTLLPIVWSSPARLSRLSFSQSDRSIRANWLCKLFLGKGIFLKLY